MNDTLLNVLRNPIFQEGVSLLTKSQPEIGLALQLIMSFADNWQKHIETNVAIKIIDARSALLIKLIIAKNTNPIERSELEIRLHELLTILIQLGGL